MQLCKNASFDNFMKSIVANREKKSCYKDQSTIFLRPNAKTLLSNINLYRGIPDNCNIKRVAKLKGRNFEDVIDMSTGLKEDPLNARQKTYNGNFSIIFDKPF